jgi:uncharacterized FlaG/YvyC family protein
MINTIKSSALLGDPSDRRSSQQQDDQEAPPRPRPAASTSPDIRLLIEQDEQTGAMTYKLIDRSTGKVISVVSREDLLNMVSDPGYAAGALLNTKA